MMAPKRKRTSSDDEAGPSRSRCNYYFLIRDLINGRSYSNICAKDSSHCNVCCRPLPHRLVENGICQTCKRKRESRNIQTGLGGAVYVEEMAPSWNDDIDSLNSLINSRDEVRDRLGARLAEFHGVKWYVVLIATMVKYNREGEEIVMATAFQGETETLLLDSDINEQFNSQTDVIMRRLKEFVSNGSGWSVQKINNIVLHVATFTPTSAPSYIPTLKYIVGKHTIINVQNEDNKCFIWSILAALHPQSQNTYRVS